MTYPRAFSHIGVSVTDLDRAIDFYMEVFGCYLLTEPVVYEEGDEDATISQMLFEGLGEGWRSLKVARLLTSDSIGIELQQFEGAEFAEDASTYRKTGVSHFCVQDPDIEGLAKKIVEHGGKQRMPVREFYPGEKPFKMVYCEDPFGNLIEIDTHSFESSYSPIAFQ
jgi:lactoylglutathione lyase family protein